MISDRHSDTDDESRPLGARDGSQIEADEPFVADGGDRASKARFELYRDEAGEWRWRLVHDNGNVIADSGEGYDRKDGARKGLRSVKRNAPDARVVVTDS